MTTRGWHPFRELEDVSDRLNRIFSQQPGARHDQPSTRETMVAAEWTPLIDVCENDRGYLLKVEIPGVPREAVKVTVQEGVLTVTGYRAQDREGVKYHRVERPYGTFARSFTLPDYVDESQVTAEFKNGVLQILLPKTEKVKPKSVEVKVT